MGYSVGDKFVIEIKEIDELNNHMVLENTAVGTDMLDKLERLDSDYVNEHYGELQDEAYQEGLNKAWELARKIFTFNNNKIKQVFCRTEKRSVFDDLTPQEALAKYEAYEKEQAEIKVGDVVVHLGTKGVILDFIDSTDDEMVVLNENGCVEEWKHSQCKKTGKHIDIQSVLEQIGGAK